MFWQVPLNPGSQVYVPQPNSIDNVCIKGCIVKQLLATCNLNEKFYQNVFFYEFAAPQAIVKKKKKKKLTKTINVEKIV